MRSCVALSRVRVSVTLRRSRPSFVDVVPQSRHQIRTDCRARGGLYVRLVRPERHAPRCRGGSREADLLLEHSYEMRFGSTRGDRRVHFIYNVGENEVRDLRAPIYKAL